MVMTVENPDAAFNRAIAAGATQVWPVSEQYGWRLGRVVDPFGHHWEIGKPLPTPTFPRMLADASDAALASGRSRLAAGSVAWRQSVESLLERLVHRSAKVQNPGRVLQAQDWFPIYKWGEIKMVTSFFRCPFISNSTWPVAVGTALVNWEPCTCPPRPPQPAA